MVTDKNNMKNCSEISNVRQKWCCHLVNRTDRKTKVLFVSLQKFPDPSHHAVPGVPTWKVST